MLSFTIDEIEEFILHTKPVNIIGYFNIDDKYEVKGFVLGTNNDNYKFLSKGKVEKIIQNNHYIVQLTQKDIESNYYAVTTDNYFKNVETLDLLNTYLILSYKNTDKKIMIKNLEKQINDVNLLNYYELCQFYLYLSTNVDLMNMPIETYTSNIQLKFDIKTNQITEGYYYLKNEMDDLKRIINDMYIQIRNYMTFAI